MAILANINGFVAEDDARRLAGKLVLLRFQPLNSRTDPLIPK
jgi:hypothetical protein